jgi:hypothetical protein
MTRSSNGGGMMKTPYLHNVGRRFSRLVAVEYVGVRSTGSMWRFRCDCGSAHEATLSAVTRRRGPTRSCGCLIREGYQSFAAPKTSTYKTWVSMRQRCNNPNASSYKNYGGRGIKICERWSSFLNFLADMGERPKGPEEFGYAAPKPGATPD